MKRYPGTELFVSKRVFMSATYVINHESARERVSRHSRTFPVPGAQVEARTRWERRFRSYRTAEGRLVRARRHASMAA